MIQQSLFPESSIVSTRPPVPEVKALKLDGECFVRDSIEEYKTFLQASGKSASTVDAFVGDLRQFMETVSDKRISEVSTQDLRTYIAFLVVRGAKPKTLHRKVTSLKNYFRWLARDQVLAFDPSESLVFPRVMPPLPEILDKDETDRFLAAAKASSNEYVLALLLLNAGLKRSDIMSLKAQNVDVSNPLRPKVRVKGETQYKERVLRLPLDFVSSYQEYLKWHSPREKLFDYTERGLNYILKSIANRASISKKVSCQILRDTFAVQCLRAGDKMDDMFLKLGLAPTTANKETRDKYQRLVDLYQGMP